MTQHEEFKATRANVRHASAVRAQLRAVLWAAAVASRLDGLNAQFQHFGARRANASTRAGPGPRGVFALLNARCLRTLGTGQTAVRDKSVTHERWVHTQRLAVTYMRLYIT